MDWKYLVLTSDRISVCSIIRQALEANKPLRRNDYTHLRITSELQRSHSQQNDSHIYSIERKESRFTASPYRCRRADKPVAVVLSYIAPKGTITIFQTTFPWSKKEVSILYLLFSNAVCIVYISRVDLWTSPLVAPQSRNLYTQTDSCSIQVARDDASHIREDAHNRLYWFPYTHTACRPSHTFLPLCYILTKGRRWMARVFESRQVHIIVQHVESRVRSI